MAGKPIELIKMYCDDILNNTNSVEIMGEEIIRMIRLAQVYAKSNKEGE